MAARRCSEISYAGGLSARVGGERPIDIRGNRLAQEVHAAVAEQEIAAGDVQAAKSADRVVAGAVVPSAGAAVDRRRGGSAVHWLVARVRRQAVLRGYGHHRAVPRMTAVAHAR